MGSERRKREMGEEMSKRVGGAGKQIGRARRSRQWRGRRSRMERYFVWGD